jgi:hypothetical protein
MRELLLLLAAGQVARNGLVDTESDSFPAQIGYEDLTALRPLTAASSWRGIMAKLLQQKLVFKSLQQGVVVFQLSKYGQDEIYRWFTSARRVSTASTWLLVMIQLQPEQDAKPAQAYRLWRQYGLSPLSPTMALGTRFQYIQDLDAQLRSIGYQSVFIPIRPQEVQPISLLSFLKQEDTSLRYARKIATLSNDSEELLKQIRLKNKLTHQQKQKIGSLVVSGLELLRTWVLAEQDTEESWETRLRLARNLDALFVQYLRNKHFLNPSQ